MFYVTTHPLDIMMATMRPKRPMASAKIKIRIIPTKSFGSIAFILTPTSPTTPIAKPEAYIINKIIIVKNLRVLRTRSTCRRLNAYNP